MFEPFPEARRVAQSGRELTVPVDISLPPARCLFCAGRDHVLEWDAAHARPVLPTTWKSFLVVLAVVLLCPFVGLLIAWLAMFTGLASRSVQRVKLPRCGPCADRQSTARIGGAATALLMGALIPIASGLLADWSGTMPTWLAVYLAIPAAAGAIAAVLTLFVHPRIARCVDVDARTVTLIVPDAEATAEALAEMADP